MKIFEAKMNPHYHQSPQFEAIGNWLANNRAHIRKLSHISFIQKKNVWEDDYDDGGWWWKIYNSIS